VTYFTCTSEGDYDRHHYKIISKNGESIVVDNWAQAHEIWWNKSSYLDRIEVLDKPQPKSRGFK
tara:strand:+ start:110 stop:301 length:192 start_codon:yes stop_codon:yes gene_type:complete